MAADAIPLQRAGNPEDIIGAALYLASDASSYTTGAVIKVDGGATHRLARSSRCIMIVESTVR
jgi:NAD(P)-dependent dehydrogenase (short-subunit alcohol dehydrogenase family)